MQNSRLNEAQAGTKIAGRNINNLRYANDTTLMAESKEELKSLLMKVKAESEKAGLKLNIQKMKIMAFGPNTSSQIGGETVETMKDFIFLGPPNHCRCWLQPWATEHTHKHKNTFQYYINKEKKTKKIPSKLCFISLDMY